MEDPAGEERLLARIYAWWVVTIYAGTFVLLWFPMLFVASGIQAIGAERGWWTGDYDGEASLTATLGLIGTGVLLTIAAALTALAATMLDRRMPGALRNVLVGSIAVVVAHGAVGVLLFTS